MILSGFIQADQEMVSSSELEQLKEFCGSTCLLFLVRTGGRRLLLKRLKPELAGDPRMVEAFRKEYETGRRLQHPNLVEYLEFHEDTDGVYILMDYVNGETLAHRMTDNAAYFHNPQHILKFFTQLLSCLQCMHAHQVLHLDIKPDNILLAKVSDDVKLIDLGFCYTDSYDRTMGRNDLYSSPEQKNGPEASVDVRSDLFAVGRLLQDLLVLVGADMKSSLCTRLEKVASRSTKADPSLRYSSAEEMLEALQYAFHPKPSVKQWVIAAALAFAVMVGLFAWLLARYVLTSPPALQSTYISTYGFCYRTLSDDSLTCEIVGHSPENPNPPAHCLLSSPADYNQRSYEVISVKDSAFAFDTIIQTVALPEGVRQIGVMSFYHCPNLFAVNLPSTLKSISHDAFASCENLRSIILPPHLTRLDRCAFVACSSLRSINIPEGVTSISVDCFVSSGLREVSLPSSLRALERGVFYNCRSLRKITLPEHLETIGDYCFHHCDSLLEVRCLNPVPPVISNIFADSIGLHRTLYVPENSLESYRQAPYWREFAEIMAL